MLSQTVFVDKSFIDCGLLTLKTWFWNNKCFYSERTFVINILFISRSGGQYSCILFWRKSLIHLRLGILLIK